MISTPFTQAALCFCTAVLTSKTAVAQSFPKASEELVSTTETLAGWDQFKSNLSRDYGLDFEFVYAPIYQNSSSRGGGATSNHEFDFTGRWSVTDSARFGTGGLEWWVINSAEYGNQSTGDFADTLGILSTPNDGDLFGDLSFTGFALLWWQQDFPNGVRLNFGKLSVPQLIGANTFAEDGRSDFFNTAVTGNATAGYSNQDSGLGGFIQYKQDTWYVSALMADGSASHNWIDFDSARDGNWQYGLEVGLTPTIAGLGSGNYRLTYNRIDNIEIAPNVSQSGYGFGISFDQELGEKHGVFLRYARALQRMTEFEQVLAGGFVINDPFKGSGDTIGLASWWVDPEESNLRDEYGFEAYWNFQITDRITLTPDIQVIFDPAKDRSRDTVTIIGMRLKVVF